MNLKAEKHTRRKETMSTLVQDLISGILSCLPVKTLLRLRCLSKSLCTEIDSPAFIKAHLNRSLQTRANGKLVLHACESGVYAFDVDERLNTSPIELSDGCTTKPISFSAHGYECCVRICGSCNGLLLSCCSAGQISICNPFTGRYNVLPVCPGAAGYSHSNRLAFVLGFGHDPSMDDYKVVQIQKHHAAYAAMWTSIQLWVFSLASNTWKELPIPYCHETFYGIYWEGVFADGFLHWLSDYIILEENQERIQVVSFDVSREVFVKAIPSIPVPSSSTRRYGVSLQALAGRLVLCETFSAHVQLSHIVKNGESFAWTKLYNLNLSCLDPQGKKIAPGFHNYEFTEVAVLEQSKDGNKILLQEYHSCFLWYDLKQGALQKYENYFDFTCFNLRCTKASFCLESLVSPGDDRLLWSNRIEPIE